MRCPFLREAQVKFCRASAYRKMIVRLPEQPDNERCSSREHINCPVAKQHLEEHPSIDHCPFLHESLVQYCTAAAVTKYIPYSESVLSRCGTESHKYCELFLTLAQPQEGIVDPHVDIPLEERLAAGNVEVKVPDNLFFAPNHMWLDVGSDGVCHIGVDAFLTSVLGTIDNIVFVTTKGFQRPTVSFSVHGVDVQFTFPIPVTIIRANTYLRTNPEKIAHDPYTVGWLFEATFGRTRMMIQETEQLYIGQRARTWMRQEIERMTSVAHQISSQPDMHGAALMADGGNYQPGMAQLLSREDLLKLYNEFFSPLAVWTSQQ